MKFLFLNIDYPRFLNQLYAQHPGLSERSYAEQMRVRMDTLFFRADFQSHALRELGHSAEDVHPNNEHMQRAWAREHGLKVGAPKHRWRFWLRRGVIPWIRRERDCRDSLSEILASQVEHYKPDVLLNQTMYGIPGALMRSLKHHARLLVGQHSCGTLPADIDYGAYDLGVSSFPPTVTFFRGKGVPAELWRLGFDPRVLDRLCDSGGKHDISFVGSFMRMHSSRRELIERVCARFPQTRIWCPKGDVFPIDWRVYRYRAGEAWGLAMYQILRDSRVTINHHGSIPPYANNLRLYEATGVGCFLLTDWKENLHEMFEPDKEVATYRTAEECAEKIAYYLEHSEERERIARAGQERTLREHTYRQRMMQFLDLIEKRL